VSDDPRTFWLIRLLYGRNNRDAPDSAPFATDALVIALGLLLFAAAVTVPLVGVPLLVAYVVVVAWRLSQGRPR
jgi:hypothetical protein